MSHAPPPAPEDRTTGKSTIPQEAVESLPEGNGSINELLTILPGIQLSDEAETSFQAGEILPPNLSISGGKVFQNNFTIDGFSNNSFIDPTFDDPTSLLTLPGHPQEIFLDTGLVESITVYDSNIPAEYGEFTGGVVDARTRDPEATLGGRLHYRTTSDRWTEFHVENEEDFTSSADHLKQPRFEKHGGGALVNFPLGLDAGILAAYQILDSRIPLRHLGGDNVQRRRLENYFLKYARDLPSGDRVTASAIYTPYEGEYFWKDTKDSEFTLKGGGFNVNAAFRHFFPWGELNAQSAYRFSEKRREAKADLFNWKNTGSKDWGNLATKTALSKEGSLGDFSIDQHSWQIKSDLMFSEFTAGPVANRIKTGIDLERVRGTLDRHEDLYVYYGAKLSDSVVCEEGDPACVDGEQYLASRQFFQADSVTATIDHYRFFAEDRLRFKRLELRPGLRVTYEDFMKNWNAAPRMAAALDIFGSGGTVLIAGRNRYYGKTLLAYKLREGSKPFLMETRSLAGGRPTPWSPFLINGAPLSGTVYRYSELKTPYTDETLIGLDQRLLGGTVRLRYIERDGNDEFAREYDKESKTHFLNNNGSSRHRGYRLSWERWWLRHYLSLNATYQKTRFSNEDYSDNLDIEELEKEIWYQGEIKRITELPRLDFNRKWVANLIYSVRLPFGFTFTNFTKYRSGYRALGDTKENMPLPDGNSLDIYDEIKRPESWIFDWKVAWRRPTFRDKALVLSLEINNVFNQKVPAGENEDEFEMGRQFWAGAEYLF
jgi:hypothetical protein